MCKQVKKREVNIDYSIYYVYGKLIIDNKIVDNNSNNTVIVNYTNGAYSVINEIDESKEYDGDIVQDENNKFEYKNYSEEDFVKEEFMDYKYTLLNELDEAYSKLDNEYKAERFNNIQEFNNYIEEKRTQIENSIVVSYEYIDDNQFIVQDDYENQYIFIENSFMNYNVRLDNYTIITENYKNKYNKLDNESKAKTNVDMFIKMINSSDYRHAYNKLDETFRNNNFGNVENFESYIKENFFENNYLIVDKIEQKGEYYAVNTTLKSDTRSAADSKNKNFVIKLNEGTNFVMSFEAVVWASDFIEAVVVSCPVSPFR